MKKIIETASAPAAIGPYSQAVQVGNVIYTAGQIALPAGGSMLVGKTVAEQTKQVLENIKAILHAAGSDMVNVVKTTVYLTDPADFAPMNEMYGHYFEKEFPARVTVFVKSLPKQALVEIDAIAEI